jgi:hypothetical protein
MPVTLVEAASEKDIIGDSPGATASMAQLSVIMAFPLSPRFKKEST